MDLVRNDFYCRNTLFCTAISISFAIRNDSYDSKSYSSSFVTSWHMRTSANRNVLGKFEVVWAIRKGWRDTLILVSRYILQECHDHGKQTKQKWEPASCHTDKHIVFRWNASICKDSRGSLSSKKRGGQVTSNCNSSATRLTSRSCTAAVAKPTDCRQGVALPAGLLSASALPAGLQKARWMRARYCSYRDAREWKMLTTGMSGGRDVQ